jgi:repressor LexA
MADTITALQKSILGFIAECLQERGYPPTLRDIGRRFGIPSTGSVAYHLKALEARGLLKRPRGISRGLGTVESPFRLPILKRVDAGGYVLAQDDVEGYLAVDPHSARGAHFFLRVPDDGLDATGILEGDLVQVRRQKKAEAGEVVLALVRGQAVVRRLRRRGDHFYLESEHAEFPTVFKDFEVIGKIVGLTRSYER